MPEVESVLGVFDMFKILVIIKKVLRSLNACILATSNSRSITMH